MHPIRSIADFGACVLYSSHLREVALYQTWLAAGFSHAGKPDAARVILDQPASSPQRQSRRRAETVLATITGSGSKHLVRITVSTGGDGPADGSLVATDGHPFWVPDLRAWVDAASLRAGQWLRTSAGTRIQITAVERWTQPATVHDLTISTLHTYYVMAGPTPVLVHNSGSCDLPRLDGTGKVHGELPDHVPDNWTAERLEELETDLIASIERRKDVNADLGLEPGHARRLADEERLLRQIQKRLSGS